MDAQPQTTTSQKTGLAFAYVTTLFFAWGFVTSLIDPLIASVRAIFDLSFAEAMLTQFAWFIAYGVVSIPAAAVLTKLGYSKAIIAALATMVLGCLIVPVSTHADFYPSVLIALFVIASGVTLLQVAANPLAASLGSPKGSHFRLTLSQAFNSLGTVLGPLIGATVLLGGALFLGGETTAEHRVEALRAIDKAFLMIAGLFVILAIFIWTARKRINTAAAGAGGAGVGSPLSAFRSKWAVFGAIAIFLYVGSEVAIGSLMTNFLHSDGVLGLPLEAAGRMVAFYWGGAMVGRFVGSVLLTRVPAGVLLSIATAVAAVLCLVVSQTGGTTAAYAALAIGFFNSIMFPAIFTLTLERSTASTASTSGLLCMAIVGGAVLPFIAGHIADAAGDLHPAFFVPLLGYIGLTIFAVAAARTRPVNAETSATPAGH